MIATSPKSSFVKLGFYPRQKSLKVMVLGQTGVGKTALVVRFVTRRYIGEYDPTLEKIYTYHTIIDNEMVYFDILDTAGQPHETECLALEANIRWAEAFILVYSVTDKCSFDECNRLKFLINYNKRRRRLGGGSKDSPCDVPVLLVGNKTDQSEDRMVSLEEGQRRSKEIGCICFHEISVRESIEQVFAVFRDVCRFWRLQSKCPSKLKRSGSEKEAVSPDTVRLICSSTVSPVAVSSLNSKSSVAIGHRWTEIELEEDAESETSKASTSSSPSESIGPFRERASTDGHLLQRPWRWRYPPPAAESNPEMFYTRANRRMSISMKGNNASY
ncbi:ras-related and estrogen-regulated growth inhibitor [Photinus pyralis]|uniref:small monomeric GTPase n=1 Tax=Photinus pyralis TaxID=7054 RepID=A0A1Y1LWU8_PHOPY|nr:ras-related and estrogen-regulated growth inhibitor [Photinus pyralis]